MIAVALLVVGIAAMFLRPFDAPLWVGPVVAALVRLTAHSTQWDTASDSLTWARNGLPVDAITEVRVLDPYFYSGKGGGSGAS